MPQPDAYKTAYDAVKRATKSTEAVDAGPTLESPRLRENLRRSKERKMIGYGPKGVIYIGDRG